MTVDFVFTQTQGPVSVTLAGSVRGGDGVFWMYGGDRPHIGAVRVSGEDGGLAMIYPGHREDALTDTLAGQLEQSGLLGHFVVCAGVHYDDIPKEWIPEILSAGRTLGQRAVSYLRERLAEPG